MPINKPHLEFHRLDMSRGWETPPGYPAGIEQKILAGALDEAQKNGSRTRLLRFQPGIYTTEPFVHDYWEEVYLVDGDLTVGNDSEGRAARASRPAPMPADRPARCTARSSRTAAVCCSRFTITSEPSRRASLRSAHPTQINVIANLR